MSHNTHMTKKRFVAIGRFLLARAQERSSWVGIIGFLAALGCRLSPEAEEAITFIGLGLASCLVIFTRDYTIDMNDIKDNSGRHSGNKHHQKEK